MGTIRTVKERGRVRFDNAARPRTMGPGLGVSQKPNIDRAIGKSDYAGFEHIPLGFEHIPEFQQCRFLAPRHRFAPPEQAERDIARRRDRKSLQ